MTGIPDTASGKELGEQHTLSVVMPAYNEEQAIGGVVDSFADMDIVDEIVVADNNSTDNTAEIAAEHGAHVVTEERQGYGYAMDAALRAATGDLVASIESDQSYAPRDVYKLLSYGAEFDVVFGDRTNRSLIESGAKMGAFLRFGNKFLGRLVQVMLGGPRITDVGCSYRLFHRDALDTILTAPVRGADLYSPQLIVEALKHNLDIVLVPVCYRERTGTSKLTKSIPHSTRIGLKMLRYLLVEGVQYRARGR